jgi:putative transposase
MARFAERHACEVHAYVLMDNHVHLLVTPRHEMGVSRMMKDLGQHYVQDFNRANKRTGTLWEGRFRSSVIQDQQYLFTCYRYIELNPVRARMVRHPSGHEWSSYRANAEGARCDFLTPHPLYLQLGTTPIECRQRYSEMFAQELTAEELHRIREAVIRGAALGSPEHAWALNASVGLSPARLRRSRWLVSAGDAT